MVAAACSSPVFTPPDPTTTTTGPETTTSESTTTVATTAEDPAQAAIRVQIDELIEVTEEYRELEFLEPPTVTIVTDEELSARVRQQIEDELDPDDLARDTALQVLLGLIDPDVDLLQLYTDLYSEQVAGYYDGELEEMVVPAGSELSALQKVTLVHELTHALTDQHFDFDRRIEDLDAADRFDELSALQSVIEGDASFTELLYVSELPVSEQLVIVREALEQDTTVLDETPRFIQDLLVFPYLQGSEFIQTLWSSQTGFDRVNEAYISPPTTTEQIFHPETYEAGEGARPVFLPETMIPGYEIEEEAIWGEVSFRVMFDQGLSPGSAERAAAGWGGDWYRVLWNGEDVAYVLGYEGDTNLDAVEMYEALVAYAATEMYGGEPETTDGATTFVDDDYAHVALEGDQVIFIASSDPGVGPLLLEAFSGFGESST
jgi:hypothetical protein